MKTFQTVNTDDAIELAHGVVVAFNGGGIVTGGEGVAGIKADAEAAWKLRTGDNKS